MITGIGSYSETTQEFSVNWTSANGELSPASLVLAGQYTQAMFAADRTTLLDSIDEATNRATDARDAAGARDTLKSLLMTRGKQFRGVVMGQITDTQVLNELPTLPKMGENSALFLDVFKAMSRLWVRINQQAVAL